MSVLRNRQNHGVTTWLAFGVAAWLLTGVPGVRAQDLSGSACVRTLLTKFLRGGPEAPPVSPLDKMPESGRLLKAGEFVQLGTKGRSGPIIGLDPRGFKREIPPGQLPMWAKYNDVFDSKHVEVEIWDPRLRGRISLRVPREDVYALPTGHLENLDRMISATRRIPYRIEAGETIRFRADDGSMKTGVSSARVPGQTSAWTVGLQDGSTLQVPQDRIFKAPFSNPVQTPRYQARWLLSQPHAPSGPVTQVKDAAARLTSSDTFRNLSEVEQIETLTSFVRRALPYVDVAKGAESSGLVNGFDDLVCAGAGVCRHQAALLGEILAETGISTQYVFHLGTRESPGHAWLELPKFYGKGLSDSLIIDPAGGTIVWRSTLSPQVPFHARHYLNLERRILDP